MKKIIGLGIIGFILVVGSINAGAASTVPSDGVLYSDSGKTVKEALDELFTGLKEKQTEIDNLKKIGTASEADILQDKTALVQGKTITGSMIDRGEYQYGTWACGESGCNNSATGENYYVINKLPEGYYHANTSSTSWAPEARVDGATVRSSLGIAASKIAKGNTIAGITGTYTSDATATSSDILSGKTAYVNGSKTTGAMTNYSEETQSATSITQSGTDALISIPSEGYYDTSSNITVPIETIKNELNLTKTLSKKADKSLTATISTLKKVGTVYKNNTEESLHCYALAYTTTATEVTVFQSIFYIGTKQVSSYIVEGGVKIQSTTTVPFTLGAGETLYLYASNTSYKEGSNTFRTILYCY